MARKFRTFVPGGLQKSVTLPDGTSSTQGTQIAGFGGQILTIDQLKTLLGLNNPNTQTPSGGTSGGSGTATITLGQGLAGGGPLLGTVRINPVSTGQGMFAEDAPDEQIMVPGPIGQRGLPGVGLPGPAVYLAPDEPNEDFNVVPGPPGPTGPIGPQGNPGAAGTSAPVVFFPDDAPDELVIPLGPRGPQGIQGPQGNPGSGGSATPIWLETDFPEPDTMPGFSLPGGFTGFGAPSALVGLTAVPGTSRLAMRSDGAPALDQSIAPTMTGAWTFTPGSSVTAVTINSVTNGISINGGSSAQIRLISSSGASKSAYKFWQGTTAASVAVPFYTGVNVFSTDGSFDIATGSGTAINLTSGGSVTINAPSVSGRTFVVNAIAGSFAIAAQGSSTASNSFGLQVLAGTSAVDVCASFINQANTTLYFQVRGDGAVLGGGPVAGTLVDMTPDASSFTGTFTGMTTTVTTTCHWSRNGNQVTLEFDAASGTSNSVSFTMTGLPAAIQPARTQLLAAPEGSMTAATGGLTNQVAVQVTAASGTATFWLGGSTTGWNPGTGVKGIVNAFSITYLLN